jgi:hypothetical protein
MIADDLRRQCDEFVELGNLMQKVGRDPTERSPRGPAGHGAPSHPGLERRYGIRQSDEPTDS